MDGSASRRFPRSKLLLGGGLAATNWRRKNDTLRSVEERIRMIAAALFKHHERRRDFRTERFVVWQKSNRSSAI
jgi:lipase chaperone LimK